MNPDPINQAAETIRRGGIVCHACEGVWGFACDPFSESTVRRVLKIKGRSMNKGLIVIGHDSSVFTTELAQISPEQRICILTSWPGHITWLVPNVRFPEWITGSFEKVAIRVPQHLQARQLAQGFGGPIVSTSANVSGEPPITSEHRARIAFADAVDAILSGEVGNVSGPSTICDAASGEFLR